MNEYEEIRKEIDMYLMKQFRYRCLVYLTPDNIVTTRKNSRIDLYLRIIRKAESLFPPGYLIIDRISFRKERIEHGSHFVRFLVETALKYGFKYIGIESVNEKSRAFTEKLGFYTIDGSYYAVSIENLISY